jgi:predicted GIY-YIG superfamily endonuclease
MTVYVYMLRCSDGRYYVGTTRASLEQRVAQHNAGTFGGFTAHRRPVTLVFHQEFDRAEDAVDAERQIKGWSRVKKEALIAGDWARIQHLARRSSRDASSFETAASRPPQDEATAGGKG